MIGIDCKLNSNSDACMHTRIQFPHVVCAARISMSTSLYALYIASRSPRTRLPESTSRLLQRPQGHTHQLIEGLAHRRSRRQRVQIFKGLLLQQVSGALQVEMLDKAGVVGLRRRFIFLFLRLFQVGSSEFRLSFCFNPPRGQ